MEVVRFIRMHYKKGVIGFGILVLFISYFYVNNSQESVQTLHTQEPPVQAEAKERIQPSVQLIKVDIKGCVKQPGVYEMQAGERVIQALEKAGGLTEKADGRSVNLAQKVADEMVIYVAAKGESDIQQPLGKNETNNKININTANTEDLQKLPGVGPAKAAAIIQYREEKGGFKKWEDLLDVKGIGEKTANKWKDQLIF